jgi:hypothetical protein
MVSIPSAVFAEGDVEDYAPVIGEFQYDADYAEKIKQKETLADLYYQAKMKGETLKASQYLKQFGQFNTDQSIVSEKAKSVSLKSASATSRRLAIYQNPQETNFWCGYAAVQSLLDFEDVSKTQEDIADEIYSADESCPWYFSNGNSRDQFPVPVYLSDYIDYFYAPYPWGPAGTTDLEVIDVKPKVVTTIDEGHGLVVCGASYKIGTPSHLPNYPDKTVRHWLAIDGYKSSGNTIWIVDPAKSDEVSWSDDIDAYYSISASKLAEYAQDRGLVW